MTRHDNKTASNDNAPRRTARFNYTAPAEMFMTSARAMRRRPIGYRRFASAAQAIKCAIEELPAPLLVGAVIEVDEERFDHQAIRALYEADGYPLTRHLPPVATAPR